jgi:antitoxin (DNA-binding transcriptional repressor) of toxin-antitoxin stability system
MAIVTMLEAKTHLSRLVARALAGEEIIIARGKTPVARIQPLPAPKRGFGSMRGRATIDEAFFEPLPEEELTAWENPRD